MKKTITIMAIAFCFNINAQIISTIAGNGTGYYSGDGAQATVAELYDPHGVALDAYGNLYIADAANYRIRKVSTNGIITTVAGTYTYGYSGDGGHATSAELNYPSVVVVDVSNNLYIADQANNRIRKVNTLGIISTFAGTGTAGHTGDGGQATAAEIGTPTGLAFDSNGNLYLADQSYIRKINTSGIITTVAGTNTVGFSGDGGLATAAELHTPNAVALDVSGNLYIADYNNHRIRKVNTAGIISTLAGNGTGSFYGDGGQATVAELKFPNGVVTDGIGNVYIIDSDNYRIRVVNSIGIINTIAGNGTQGYYGDGGQATAAELNIPYGITLDGSNNLYVGDGLNNRVRMISASTTINVNSPSICIGSTATLTASGANSYTWNTGATIASISPSPTTTTTFSVIGTNTITSFNTITSSVGTATTSVIVNPLPTVTATSNTTTLCSDSTAILQAQGASTYTWSTSATSPTVAVTPTVTTTYTVTGTNVNGCVNTATLTQVVTSCNTTGINHLVRANQLNIYPNPSNGNFVIETGNDESQTLHVYDVTGKLVLSQAVAGITAIDASILNEGIYNLSIFNGTGVVNKRLIIEK
jgi:type IX secretion system substrate protein/NHL repeat-containing protein